MRNMKFTDGASVDVRTLRNGMKVFSFRPALATPHPSEGGSNMTLVRFVGQLNRYTVLVPANGEPLQLAKTFLTMGLDKQGMNWNRRASEVATAFLRTNSNAVLTERGSANPTEWALDVDVYSMNVTLRKGSKIEFQGTMKEFVTRDEVPNYEKFVGKILKFNYKGGSHVGKERIVKLDKVVGTGKATLLKGWDVVQTSGEKKAWRSYRVSNIMGAVEVLG